MTDNFTPVDRENRDRIAGSLAETLFVEAGAGTGKTTALVARIVSLVKDGNEISGIAAITFTEAAAAELRDRVRRELQAAAIREDNAPGHKDTADIEKARCLKAVADVDNASIQTLHAFAGAILREQPLEAGLPPGFEVAEEIESGIDFEERWQCWMDEAMNSAHVGDAMVRSMRLGLSLDRLKAVAAAFHENYDILPPGFSLEPEPDRIFLQQFVDVVSQFGSFLKYCKNDREDKLASHCLRLLESARRIEMAGLRSDAALVILTRAGKLSFTRGNKADWETEPQSGVNACTLIKKMLSELQVEISTALEQTRRAAFLPILDSLRQFALDYSGERRREGRLQFHDLLIFARDLLKNKVDVRRYFQRKFSHILIDEFQDTDPIQAEIAFFLAENADEVVELERKWLKVPLKPGKLFVVGDPKQSIYRFRRADIAAVGEVKRLICGGASSKNEVPLTQNFRSLSPVIEWVNAVFGQCMTDDGSGNQACYLPLEPRWEPLPCTPQPGVHFLGGPVEGRAAEVRRMEAEDIAHTMSQMKSMPWQVRNEKEAGLRPVKYRDICLLMPTRTGLQSIERELDNRSIPYRVESQSMLLGTEDVKELLACLRAIDSPSDRIALVAALRSSTFSISDVELLQFVENGGNLDYTSPGAADGRVKEALAVLAEYHRQHIWHSPADIIQDFIRRRSMEEVCFGRMRPRERIHRLQFVMEKARDFSEVEGSSLRGFLDWIERLADENARMIEVPVPETDEDAVRIMTIHAAKGREFPVVVLTGLGSGSTHRSEAVVFDRRGNSVEVSIGTAGGPGFTTSGYDEAKTREQAAEEAERIRLMYVAATRAKDHLIVSLFRPRKNSDTSFAGTLETICKDKPGIWRPVEFQPSGEGNPEKENIISDETMDTEEDRQKWLEKRAALLKQASGKVSVSATAVASINKEAVEDEFPYRTGRGGTKLGRAVHSVLQTIDLATGAGLEEIAGAQAANEGIPERAAEVAELVKKALGSRVVKRAVASGCYYREVYVSAPLEKCSVDGFIDLLFEEEDGLVIVDYKTDAIGEEPSEAKSDQYGLQAGIYALAASRVTGKPVKEVILLSLKGPKEISFKDLDNLMALAEKAIGRALAGKNVLF